MRLQRLERCSCVHKASAAGTQTQAHNCHKAQSTAFHHSFKNAAATEGYVCRRSLRSEFKIPTVILREVTHHKDIVRVLQNAGAARACAYLVQHAIMSRSES
jgi:hypothetical protein